MDFVLRFLFRLPAQALFNVYVKLKSSMGAIVSCLRSLTGAADDSLASRSPVTEEEKEESNCAGDKANQPNNHRGNKANKLGAETQVVFGWRDPNYAVQSVQLAGSFDGWSDRVNLKRPHSSINAVSVPDFEGHLILRKGELVQFKFVVDGIWKCSANYAVCDNGMGDYNNYLIV